MPPAKKKSLSAKIETFGMSFNAVTRIGDLIPDLPLRKAVRSMASFLLKAESREEVRWLSEGIPILERHFGMPVLLERSKAVSFRLPGGVYTPDFMYILEDGRRIHVEVKGSRFQPNYRDARSKVRTAATLYWFDTFCEARIENKEWLVEHIPPDMEYRTELQSLLEQVRSESETASPDAPE